MEDGYTYYSINAILGVTSVEEVNGSNVYTLNGSSMFKLNKGEVLMNMTGVNMYRYEDGKEKTQVFPILMIKDNYQVENIEFK